jgi:hypothetical protein
MEKLWKRASDQVLFWLSGGVASPHVGEMSDRFQVSKGPYFGGLNNNNRSCRAFFSHNLTQTPPVEGDGITRAIRGQGQFSTNS